MFPKFYDDLHRELNDVLGEVMANESDPVKVFSAAMPEISKTLNILRERSLAVPFAGVEEEVLFFKTVKPRFYALKIFHFELYALLMNKPVDTKDVLIAYYKQELQILSRFFSLHAGPYTYFRTGRSELDQLYFVRDVEMPELTLPDFPDGDSAYSTPMDYLFSKFIAYEALQLEILQRIGKLDGAAIAVEPTTVPQGINWTGKVVNLCELIYGLYYTGQLNHGNTQLSDIVALFERMFSVKIRDVHHTFGEIRERKVTSPSKFLDSMAAAIRDRVDEDLKYKAK